MPKVPREVIAVVGEALLRYDKEVSAYSLTTGAKQLRWNQAAAFVRWLNDDYTPDLQGKVSTTKPEIQRIVESNWKQLIESAGDRNGS